MRIEALRTLVAVVLLTALWCPRPTAANNLTLSRRSRENSSPAGNISQWETEHVATTLKRSGGATYREIQNLLRRESGDEGAPVECCPSVEELIDPVGGKNREGSYVELYRDGENKQVFYEYSCRADVLDQPCRFIDRKLANQSKCVQKFSYTYALVKDTGTRSLHHHNHNLHHLQHHNNKEHRHRHGRTPDSVLPDISTGTTPGTKWNLDYIQVRSGCSCQLYPKQPQQQQQKKRKNNNNNGNNNNGISGPHRGKKSKGKWRKTREQETAAADWEK